MISCKQVSNALARQDYASLPALQRAGLKLHVAMCLVCGKYNRQVMLMQDAARIFRKREAEDDSLSPQDHLTDQEKESLKAALRRS